MTHIAKLIAVTLLLSFGICISSAHSQAYPNRLITVIAQYPAGGTPDLVGRIVTEKLASLWKSPIIVEPKPGANGAIGTANVSQATPDGYTWLIATLSHVTNPILQENIRWDPITDFEGVSEIGTAPVIAVVPTELKVDTLRQFVERAKAAPGKLNYLMPGVGTSMHLNTEMLMIAAGIDLVAIPYKGIPAGLLDLLSGRLSFGMLTLSTAAPHLKAGKLTALAVVSPTRINQLAGVPTLSEAGYPEAQVLSWYTILVPAKTPQAIVTRINEALDQVLSDSDIQERLRKVGVFVSSDRKKPEQVDAMLKRESLRWKDVFKNLKVETR